MDLRWHGVDVMTLDQLSRIPATPCADIAAKVAEILDRPGNHAWIEVFLTQQLRRVEDINRENLT